MQRRHFELIAEILNNYATGDAAQRETVRAIAEAFASRLARENARFDRDRFLRACGITD